MNKQFELLEFVVDSVHLHDKSYLNFTAGYVSLCFVCSHVVVFSVSVRCRDILCGCGGCGGCCDCDACTVVCVVCVYAERV